MGLPLAKPTKPLCRGPTKRLFGIGVHCFFLMRVRTIDDPPYYDLEFVMAWRNASS